MKFGIFYEHQLPRPWEPGSELRLFQDALAQVELADRLGHGIVLMPPAYNHPARVAERIATLDLVSNGRVDFGTGESASRAQKPHPPNHYAFGKHTPGRTNIWNKYAAVRDAIGTDVLGGGTGCIGTPDQLRDSLRAFEAAGVDQTVFIQQGGRNLHEHIVESLELFAALVMPEFQEREARKTEELRPSIEAALGRKPLAKPLTEDEIPTFEAYGLSIAEVNLSELPEANRRRMREIAERA